MFTCNLLSVWFYYNGFWKARKALRALKGLVKIQALVRGYLVRKQATATLHGMQALIRAQATVKSKRAQAQAQARVSYHGFSSISQQEFIARRSLVIHIILFKYSYFYCFFKIQYCFNWKEYCVLIWRCSLGHWVRNRVFSIFLYIIVNNLWSGVNRVRLYGRVNFK